jgi:high-affinity K+ transport system ATPase subunit B
MNRKDKTVKQLQAECRKRKIGFMMNWTKAALIKRLEDEDKREKAILELQEKLEKTEVKGKKALLKTKKDLEVAKTTISGMKIDSSATQKGLHKQLSDAAPAIAWIDNKEKELASLKKEWDTLDKEQKIIINQNNSLAKRKRTVFEKIESVKLLMESLK